MKFRSKKDIVFNVMFWGLNIFLMTLMISEFTKGKIKQDEYLTIIPFLSTVGFLFWLYYGTNYKLSKNKELIYRSGPFYGKIEINNITEIIKGKTPWFGIGPKPATSTKGLIIKYDKKKEIYITPKTNELFITKILEFKSDIKITK